ncbi:MAG: amino acid synthesis family protein [Pseudomonadota bacterium]
MTTGPGPAMRIRKIQMIRETVLKDEAGRPCDPIQRVAALAVVHNPFAGAAGDDLSALFEIGGLIGERLMAEAMAPVPLSVAGYGKAAIIGVDGAMEHGAAILHPRLGRPMREAIGGGAALIPANTKIGGPGTAIDLPLGHKDDPLAFDHIDTLTVTVGDAPRADEIVVVIGLADGPRPHARSGSRPGAV